jgi:hypothetical protein
VTLFASSDFGRDAPLLDNEVDHFVSIQMIEKLRQISLRCTPVIRHTKPNRTVVLSSQGCMLASSDQARVRPHNW